MRTIKKLTILLISLFFSTMLLANECEVKVKIRPPQHDGGSPITGYWIEARCMDDGRWYRLSNWSLLPTVLEYTFTGGFKRTRYEFRVIAINKYGVSKPSDPDHADFSKSDYWEVFLVCENGATGGKYTKSNTSIFEINKLLDILPKGTTPIPYRPEE